MMPSRKQQEELMRLLEEKKKRISRCPIAAFTPNPGGQTTLEDMAEKWPVIMGMGGNRSGKTHWLVKEIICTLLGYRPYKVPGFSLECVNGEWRFPHRNLVTPDAWVLRTDGLPIRHPCRCIYITGLPMSRGIGEIFMPKWKSLWPPDVKIKSYYGPLGTWVKLEAAGSQLIISADTQQVSSFEGANYDRAFADEPIRKQVFTAVRRGLVDMRGQFIWSMTPLGDAKMAWVAHDLILNEERSDVGIVYLRARDNAHVDQEALDAFLSDPTMSKEEREAREEGKLGAIGKRIISTYDQAVTLIPPTDIPANVPRMLVVDPHHNKPSCLVWFALMSDDHWIAYREWPERPLKEQGIPKMDTAELAGMIKSMEGREHVEYRICDPAFGRQHAKVLGQTFASFQEQMADFELYFDANVDNDLERGIGALRDAFRVDPITRRPKVQVFNTLKNVSAGLNLWSYEEKSDGSLKPSEVYKDFVDCVRYGIMYNPSAEFSAEGSTSYLIDEDD
jgi:hypothetical protein